MGADLRGADGAFENPRDFSERQFLKSGEQQDFAVIVIEARQRHAEEFVVVARRRVMRGMRCVVGMVEKVDRIGRAGRGVGLAEVIRGAAARQMIHPRGEAAVVTIGVPVFQHALKDDLRDVLRGSPIAGVLDEEAEERPVVAFKEFAQRIEFAPANGEHQGVVGALFNFGFHGAITWRRLNHGRA